MTVQSERKLFCRAKGAVKDEDVKWLYNLRDARDAQVHTQEIFRECESFGLSRSQINEVRPRKSKIGWMTKTFGRRRLLFGQRIFALAHDCVNVIVA